MISRVPVDRLGLAGGSDAGWGCSHVGAQLGWSIQDGAFTLPMVGAGSRLGLS